MALRRLQRQLPPVEFLGLCDELLRKLDEAEFTPVGMEYYWEGEIRWLKAQADPAVLIKPERFSPAEQAYRRLLKGEFQVPLGLSVPSKDEIPSRTVDEWNKDYHAYLESSLPEHLLARFEIAGHLHEHPDKASARRMILELLPHEPDFAIRARLAVGLRYVSPLGDEEAVQLLEFMAEREPDVRSARSSMLSVAHYLRTGE